jgi:hypothetical protein
MPILFLALTCLSLIVLLFGAVWALILFGQTRRRSGPEVGAEIMARRMDSDLEGIVGARRTFFKGKATAVEREASFSLAEIKQALREGRCLHMIPVLLVIGGFLGLFLFGAATAWLIIPNKLIAGLIAIAALYVVIRRTIDFVRA